VTICVEICRARRTARRDTLVTTTATGATRTTRVQGRRHSVDWGGHVHFTFSRSCSRDRCKSRAQKTKRVHAPTTASASFAMLGQVRLNKLVTTRSTCRTCRVVSRRDEPSGIWTFRDRMQLRNARMYGMLSNSGLFCYKQSTHNFCDVILYVDGVYSLLQKSHKFLLLQPQNLRIFLIIQTLHTSSAPAPTSLGRQFLAAGT